MYRMLPKLVLKARPLRVAAPLLLLFLMAVSACQVPSSLGGGPDADEAAEADTMATLLTGVDVAAFRAAFGKIGDYSYTRYTRTEQFDTDDYLVAYRESVHRRSEEGGIRTVQTEEADSAGTFDFGFFDRFTSSNLSDLNPVDLIPYLLPDDPAYLKARNREKYEWRYLPDTLLWDTQAQVIELSARPLVGDGQNVRRVRHYVDRTTNELIAMYLERIDLALLFREESRFWVHMRRTGEGELVPHNTRFHTHIKTPFRTDSKFRTVSTYYEMERLPGAGITGSGNAGAGKDAG
jgi:hypothetical protein